MTKALRSLIDDPDEPNWFQSFNTWQWYCDVLRTDSTASALWPETSGGATATYVVSPSDEGEWWNWHQERGLAVRAQRPEIPDELENKLLELHRENSGHGLRLVAQLEHEPGDAVVGAPWLSAFVVIPAAAAEIKPSHEGRAQAWQLTPEPTP
jgi:hypothetical protein